MRILIVDADLEFRDIAKRLMNQCGLNARFASNGLECVECLRDYVPDALVLNRELLWGGSEGVLELISEEASWNSIPIILVTDDQELSGGPSSKLRIVKRLKKPCSLTQLVNGLQAIQVDHPGILI